MLKLLRTRAGKQWPTIRAALLQNALVLVYESGSWGGKRSTRKCADTLSKEKNAAVSGEWERATVSYEVLYSACSTGSALVQNHLRALSPIYQGNPQLAHRMCRSQL